MATAGNNIYNQVASGMQNASTGMTNAMNYKPMDFSQQALQQYMSPYTSQVIDRTMGNLEDARLKAINAGQAKAMSSGAYGGSRHGVSDSLTNQAFARQAGDMATNLNQANYSNAMNQFNTANQLGLQNAQNQMAGASGLSGMANLGFGMANTMDNTAYQRAERERMIAQQLADKASGQFKGFTGQGQQGFNALLQSLGIIPAQTVQTQTQQPGLFDFLTLGVSGMAGLPDGFWLR